MPCNSDFLEPNQRERAKIEAAELLIFVYKRLRSYYPHYAPLARLPKGVRAAAKHPYGEGADCIPLLCAKLRDLQLYHSAAFSRIVYDAHNRTSRRLADWWEDHCKQDRKLGRGRF